MKFKSILTVALSALALVGSAAPKKVAFYCGNYTGVFSRAFANVYGKTGDTSNFVLNEKADMIVFSHLGKYTGPQIDKAKLLAYAENGGIVLMFCVSLFQERKGSIREALWNKPVLRYILVFVLLVIVLLMGSYGIGYNASDFIYNQF